MKWILVFIWLDGLAPNAVAVDNPMTMEECFSARELLSETVGGSNGYFPLGTQAICVRVSGEED